MSTTPPPSRRPDADANPAGDGVEVGVTPARGGMRTGRMIWVLVISLAAIVVLFGVYWAVNAPHMQNLNHPSGQDLNAHDVNTFNAPEPAARPSTTGTAANAS